MCHAPLPTRHLDPASNAGEPRDADAALSLLRLVLDFASLPLAQRDLAEDYAAAIAAGDEARAAALEGSVGMGE